MNQSPPGAVAVNGRGGKVAIGGVIPPDLLLTLLFSLGTGLERRRVKPVPALCVSHEKISK